MRAKMSDKEHSATLSEIRAAYYNLKEAEFVRLDRYARALVRGLGQRNPGYSSDDLLQEAYKATLTGERLWKKDAVDFCRHLAGVMKSLANHLGEKFDRNEGRVEWETPGGPFEAEADDPLSRVPSPLPDAERSLAAREEVAQVERLVKDHSHAILVLEGLYYGMTGPEIQKELGISKNDYEAIMKWMRRRLKA
jgi:DNA-directed RNA polymerase specialized sigma24 family protein